MRLIMLFLVVGATSAFWQNTTSGSGDQIRSVRQEIDDAFQRHDARQLATLVTSDCHFTAPSVHTDGADALARTFSHVSLHEKARRDPDAPCDSDCSERGLGFSV